jgi:hypothetical protein
MTKGRTMNAKIRDVFVLIGLLAFCLPFQASAYIDLGTGSYFLQIAIAGLLGFLFTLKMFFKRITRFFHGIITKKKDEEI